MEWVEMKENRGNHDGASQLCVVNESTVGRPVMLQWVIAAEVGQPLQHVKRRKNSYSEPCVVVVLDGRLVVHHWVVVNFDEAPSDPALATVTVLLPVV